MRIIHIASGDLWAGAEVQLFHLAVNINKRGDVDLLVVLLNDGQLADELRCRDINVLVINEAKYSTLKIMFKFYNICRQFKPDIIHTHRIKENMLGGFVAWLIRCKSVRTVHGAAEFTKGVKSAVINFIDKFVACALQQKVIAVSYELMGKLKSSCYRDKIAVIENCIDIDYVENKALTQTNYNINKEEFNIAFVGRFVAVKRTDLFVSIAAEIKKRNLEQNIKFHMFGDGPLWEQTQKFIDKHNLTKEINLAGFVDNSAPYIKQMDLLLITSDHEGLPMTLLESMALKTPVMSRDLVTIKHVLCDGNCGYIVSSDLASVFADEIINIIDNKESYNELQLRAYNRVVNNYSIQVLIEQYIKLYTLLTHYE